MIVRRNSRPDFVCKVSLPTTSLPDIDMDTFQMVCITLKWKKQGYDIAISIQTDILISKAFCEIFLI